MLFIHVFVLKRMLPDLPHSHTPPLILHALILLCKNTNHSFQKFICCMLMRPPCVMDFFPDGNWSLDSYTMETCYFYDNAELYCRYKSGRTRQ